MRLRRFCFVLLTALVATTAAASATDCGWLATSELDRLFPEGAPWRVMAGGAVGRCQFLSRSDAPPSIFSANQMIEESPEAAVETTAKIREQMDKNGETVDRPALGEGGFSSAIGDATGVGARTVNLVGHRGRVVALAMLSLQSAVEESDIESASELVKAALSIADDPKAMAAATDCPWFEPSIFDRLLPGGGVTQQVLGENSCMAQDKAHAVLLVSVFPFSPALMNRSEPGCTWEDQPALGAGATIGHGCPSGNPRATLRMKVGDKLVEYNLTGGGEPSADQRQALVALATAVRQRQAP